MIGHISNLKCSSCELGHGDFLHWSGTPEWIKEEEEEKCDETEMKEKYQQDDDRIAIAFDFLQESKVVVDSGLDVYNDGLMTIDGNATTIHHNGTNGDGYGLYTSSSSSIHLVSPLTKEMISTNNHNSKCWFLPSLSIGTLFNFWT